MLKAILFDFDGTLSNRYKNAYHVFKDYLKKWFPDLNDLEYEAVLQDFVTYDVNGTTKVEYRIVPFVNKYKLPEEEDLLIIKGDLVREDLTGYAATEVQYVVFSTSLQLKLDLNYCRNEPGKQRFSIL